MFSEKQCNPDGLIRRPNEKLERKEGEEEELQSQIPEFRTIEKALVDAQKVPSSGSLSSRKDADVIAHVRVLFANPPGELLMYKSGNFSELSCSMVFLYNCIYRLSGTKFLIKSFPNSKRTHQVNQFIEP